MIGQVTITESGQDCGAELGELRWFLSQCRAPRLRSLREFAEAEIVIPNGPRSGERFRCTTQPFSRLWFDAIDSGKWRRFVAIGPTQSGKTLIAYVIPQVYGLFERGETVISGVPSMDMADDKWRDDLLPVLGLTRYATLLPSRGGGSRGGKINSANSAVQMGNGATLKFMSGGGGDSKRSGYTARMVAITEVDKLDVAGDASREADKVSQMEARTDAWDDAAILILESTPSYSSGRVWREYTAGTATRIAVPCPRCAVWVTPDRSCLKHWQTADTEANARSRARWVCPECAGEWSEDERIDMNRQGVGVHRGQAVTSAGAIDGQEPPTQTYGLRWDAFNNLFWNAASVAAREWKAAREPDEVNSEKKLRQFVWALPWDPPQRDLTELDLHSLTRRCGTTPRGVVPEETRFVSAGVDIGKWRHHWAVTAWTADAVGTVLAYGECDVPSADMAEELAIVVALRELADALSEGYADAEGTLYTPSVVLVDSGNWTEAVYAFVRERGRPWWASKGLGASQAGTRRYQRPRGASSQRMAFGDGYHVAALPNGQYLVEIDADKWKDWLHARLRAPAGSAGSMVFHAGELHTHRTLSRHLTSERQSEEYVPGRGLVTRWENTARRANHYLDAVYMACVAAHISGMRLQLSRGESASQASESPAQTESEAASGRGLRMPDGRRWL